MYLLYKHQTVLSVHELYQSFFESLNQINLKNHHLIGPILL